MILGYLNGLPVFETRVATAHDPHSGQFTSGGGSSSLGAHLGTPESHNQHAAAWFKKLTGPEKTATGFYQDGGYRHLNHALRQGSISDEHLTVPGLSRKHKIEKYQKTSALLDSALHKGEAPHTMEATRYLIPNHQLAPYGKIHLGPLKKGAIYKEPAFSSTSLKGASSFENYNHGANIVMHIKIPKGAKGGFLPNYNSLHPLNEFLLPRNTSYKITDVKHENGKTLVYAEVIN